MKTQIRTVNDHGIIYSALIFVCPGCVAGAQANGIDSEGIHMLPVNAPPELQKPSWSWNGNEELPTLSPSILTRGGSGGNDAVCHCFLKDGVFQFLDDCTHPLVGQTIPIPDLPEWATKLN